LRLRNKGLPDINGYGMGDLLVKISLYVPETLTNEEKKEIEKLGKSKNLKPTDSAKSKIFRRFKRMFN
ncbi:MAG: molecular chaperone DnaJ, partial [Bacteroides sp.]|nr:molecular chaperone DnaJ [Bacteroides sp.]